MTCMPERVPDPPPANASLNDRAHRQPKPLGFLAWIAGYKLVKALLAMLGGIVVLRLGNQNLVELATRLLVWCRFDPEGWVGTRLLRHVGHFNPQHFQF